MNFRNCIHRFVSGVGRAAAKKSPEITLGLGIGMAFAAIVTAVTATPKALKQIEERQAEIRPRAELGAKETVKTVWKYYIPTAVLFAASTACLIGSHHIGARRAAALAAACSVTETALREYRDAVVENVAPEVMEKIEGAVAGRQIQSAKDPRDAQIFISDSDGVSCYEPQSGRYFKSTKERIEAAVNELNHDMLCDGFGGSVSLNDFYDKIGLPDTDAGAALGWNTSNGLVGVLYSSQLAKDGTPCLVIKYDRPPVYNFDRVY